MRPDAETTGRAPLVLLFDLGGVLIDNPGFQNFNKLLPVQIELAELKTRWLLSAAVRRFESGQCNADAFAVELLREWELAIDPTEFIANFTGWPADVTVKSIGLIRQLRRNHRVACLSNSNELHWDRFRDLVLEFDVAISSHLTGLLKPDKATFIDAAKRCGAAPRDICFFDDSLLNVEAALAAGMRAYLVDGVDELQAVVTSALAERGSATG